MDVDYVIVGAGAAGCVLAERLSADPAVRVLLLEAGGAGRGPLLEVPKAFAVTMRRPSYAVRYPVHPPRERARPPGQGEEVWLRGQGLGGSTLINGMVYMRGAAADYDGIEAAGNPGWGWTAMLREFRALEDHALGPSPVRGVGGPVGVSVPASDHPVVTATLAAASARGLTRVVDVNAGDDPRIGFTPSTIAHGRRVSAASAFLRRARSRPNLTVLTHARVGFLLLAGRRVVGVRARHRGRVCDHRVRREVILAAGALESPLILERSGIGDPAVLARAGIAARVERPAVGEGLIEHRGVSVHARVREDLRHPLARLPGRVGAGAAYLSGRRGPLASGPYELVALTRSDAPAPRSDAQAPRPDVQLFATALAPDPAADVLRPARHAGLFVTGYQLRPTSTGSVHVTGPAPDDPPSITAGHLTTAVDRAVTGGILDLIRGLLATEPLAGLVTGEEAPGPAVASPDEVVGYASRTGGGLYHAVGSCAMGPGERAVVDDALRVRGVEGLRVVDASVFPVMPSGNTGAPTMALARRAAGLIAGG